MAMPLRVEWERGTEGDAALLELRRLVRRMLRKLVTTLSPDIADDCLFEAHLCLWQIRERVEALPEKEQSPYIYICLRRAVYRVLWQELRYRKRNVAVDEAELPVEMALEEGALLSAQGLLSQIRSPSLASALSVLPTGDYQILDLFYASGMTDIEISRTLQLKPGAVKMRRHRIVARLRRRLNEDAA